MKFGLLKSKIEQKLTESFEDKSFKKDIDTFKKLVLENNKISRIYNLYNELSKEKNFEAGFAEDYLNECIDIYQAISLKPKDTLKLEKWVNSVVSENHYKDIDIVFTRDTPLVENIMNSKTKILKSLTSTIMENAVINISMEKMVEVANKTVNDYLSKLDESEAKEVKKYINLSKSELEKRYEFLSEIAIEKLEVMSENSEPEVQTKINETINKIKNDNVDVVSLVKLKTLTGNL
jgi:hypothetical protein